VIGISQVLWGSIGYATGATLGAALAARELEDTPERRVILFTGEGSLQLTVQVSALKSSHWQ
jgi:pyruvate decarboxylase